MKRKQLRTNELKKSFNPSDYLIINKLRVINPSVILQDCSEGTNRTVNAIEGLLKDFLSIKNW